MPLSKENDLAHKLIGIAIEIHKTLGPGLNPEVYQKCLMFEFENHGLSVVQNQSSPVQYKDLVFDNAIECTYIIDDAVAIMIDSSDSVQEYRVFNMVRYLKQENLKLGLIVNFNASLMKNGIRRVTNHKLLEEIQLTDSRD